MRECREALAQRGTTVIHEVIGAGAAGGAAQGAAAEAVDWRHYPADEVYDPTSHAQYFYHRHSGEAIARRQDAPPESGHFHLFLRGEGMPAGMTPLLLPEVAVAAAKAPPPRQSAPLKRGSRDEVCHLVAIALDGRGEPVRLFTTNRWVTGETWYRADDVIGMLKRFRVGGEHPSALVNRWLGALVRLFAGDIAALLEARDKAIQAYRWRWRSNVLEDPRLEIPSSLAIDLDARLAAVELDDGGVAATSPARRPLRMAEGWGA